MAIRIAKNSSAPSLTDTLTIDGIAFDLTGATVRFKMRPVGSSTTKVNAPATIVSAVAGTVRYDWIPADLDTAGDFLGWWSVVTGAGRVQDHPEFVVSIEGHEQPAGALCEVADVREALESTSHTTDALIRAYIARASVAITNYAQREFTATGTATRPFRLDRDRRILDLAPYDLQIASAVTDTPVGGAAVTLTSQDYDLDGPFAGGTYLYLRLSRSYPRTFNGFDYSRIAITGTWGMPAIPAAVTQAAVLTVRSWLRTEPAAYDSYPRDVAPAPPGGWMLPTAAKQLLDPYRRVTV